jgi:hypothetical protein
LRDNFESPSFLHSEPSQRFARTPSRSAVRPLLLLMPLGTGQAPGAPVIEDPGGA